MPPPGAIGDINKVQPGSVFVRRSLQRVYFGTDQLIRILEAPRVIKGRWGYDDMINTTRHWREEQRRFGRTPSGMRRHQDAPTGRNFVYIQWMMSNFDSVNGKRWNLALDLTYPWCPLKFEPDFVLIKLGHYQDLVRRGILPADPREDVTSTILQMAT